MAKDPPRTPAVAEDEPNEPAAASSARRFRPGSLLTRKWLAILLVASIVGHGIGYTYYRLRIRAHDPPADLNSEVSLGVFRFLGDKTEGGRVTRAEFSLHLGLLEHVDRAGRDLLAVRRYRVQEGVEELLRRAHGGDFEDPSLVELKRKIQERVNECLGMRVVDDVIVTDLVLRWDDHEPKPASKTAESVPRVGQPSG